MAGTVAIGLMFYIGRTRIKVIDKAVLGYEFPNDSIFSLIIRIPNYASGFLWEWSARRTGLKRSEERRVGKEWASMGRSRRSPYH